jgi:hypothetical protein
MGFWLFYPVSGQTKNEVDQGIDCVVMLFAPEPKQLHQKVLASLAREFDRAVLDIPSGNAKPSEVSSS